ncbi:hypothetical protein EW146_g10374 [Bondarzewia mesenterica]|uniref:Condensin complex subunit 1 N-terminal domain-containing protein n=1 Tax=Bondarzewia mesenterica TaxID=1095465 RepID=A0A4S4KXP3_9AGAM|nr:hypothetical protein EW146_g10374 [Bondarzewia mesenterica]
MTDFDLQEELQSIQDLGNYNIENEHDLHSMEPNAMSALLDEAVGAVSESSESIADPRIFDIYRSLLKHADVLPGPLMSKLLDSISSGFLAQTETAIRDVDHEDQQTYVAHKTPLEMYAFLLNWFVGAAEKVKGSAGDDVPVAPVRSRRGRGGKAAQSKNALKQKAAEWSWEDQIPPTLALISKVLRLKTNKLWTTSAHRETFVR